MIKRQFAILKNIKYHFKIKSRWLVHRMYYSGDAWGVTRRPNTAFLWWCWKGFDSLFLMFRRVYTKVQWLGFIRFFLSFPYLGFCAQPFKNYMYYISLYLYQFWSSFFWLLFVLFLILFEVDFIFQFHPSTLNLI